MKKTFTFCFLLISLHSFSQFTDGRLGITAGITNYSTKTDFLFSKSGIGYTLGVMGTAEFSDRSELFVEVNYTKHFVKFIGRENETAPPQDLKFNLQNVNIGFLFNYNYLVIDEYKLGVNAGPTFSFLYQYELVDDSKSEYVLDPLYASPNDLQFDTRNEQISFNTFLSIGLSAQYDFLMANLRYHYGLTDPYRNAPVVAIIDINGKDSFLSFTVTCFL
ncbi:outer membrane beta-barrel protein [uncultured Aquimarina sp.]|uniref:outer membrane beta-barrel protein n=1 Tax=uncultured Aquimarina sp. TaxID=575652 RepID=UPI00261E14E7|nr:outer membrane beta-barrel protein [uncultured Aquimarina sp.]